MLQDRLLYRFFEPKSGSIKFGDHDIKAIDLDCLRKHIAIVPQDSVLFHNTILHNINYGDLKASEEKVIQAAQMAEIHQSILVIFQCNLLTYMLGFQRISHFYIQMHA